MSWPEVLARRNVQGGRGEPWLTVIGRPTGPQACTVPAGPEMEAWLHPARHRKPNRDPLFWEFPRLTPQGYLAEARKQADPGAPLALIQRLFVEWDGTVEFARRLAPAPAPAGGEPVVIQVPLIEIEIQGAIGFLGSLYREMSYAGGVTVAVMLDRPEGLLLQAGEDGPWPCPPGYGPWLVSSPAAGLEARAKEFQLPRGPSDLGVGGG